MPKDKGPEWEYVTEAEPNKPGEKPKQKCKLCHHKFFGGAPRIRHQFLGITGSGVAKCKAAPEKLGPVAEVMQSLEKQSRSNEPQGIKKRQLDKATSSLSSSSAAAGKRQRTLAECQRGASKAEYDEAVARFLYADGHPLSVPESTFFKDMLDKALEQGSQAEPWVDVADEQEQQEGSRSGEDECSDEA